MNDGGIASAPQTDIWEDFLQTNVIRRPLFTSRLYLSPRGNKSREHSVCFNVFSYLSVAILFMIYFLPEDKYAQIKVD